MSRNVQLIVLLGVVAIVGSLATVVFAVPNPQSAAAKSMNQSDSSADLTEDGLEVIQDTKDEIQGSFEEPDKPAVPAVQFHSEVKDSVNNEFVKDNRTISNNTVKDDKFAVTRVKVGNLTIASKRNLRTQTIVESAGGKRITAEQTKALTALSRALTEPYGVVGSKLPPDEDMLVRIVAYYAEAPAGLKIKDMKVRKPTAGSKEMAPISEPEAEFVNVSYRYGTENEVEIPSKEQCAQAKASRNFVAFTACRRPDNDGIRYLSCSYRTHRLWHDAPNHCGRTFRRTTGPYSSNYPCRGSCGAGCNNATGPPTYRCRGWGAYTRDCAEHDDCGRHHPNSPGFYGDDRACGDQFWEAYDDFRYARINCAGRC